MKKRIAVSVVGAWSLLAVASHYATAESADGINAEASAPGKKQIVPPLRAEAAPRPSPRLDAPTQKELPTLIARYFEGNVGRRLYIQVDKPLYKPGETIWFKTWDLKVRALTGADTSQTTVELVSPKGATVLKRRIHTTAGSAASDFDLPAEVQGGEYTLRAIAGDGQRAERAIIVSAYEPPRLKKKLEFVKKAYGAGDAVSATVTVTRPTGEALGGKTLTAVITVDGVELPRVKVTSNADGGALVKFELPKTISAGDGLLTILVEDGGITESISKAIPILQKKLALAFFPEGGKMVSGLPTRLYFEAKTLLGKPADVEGRLVDDLGNAVATFGTYKNGLGRMEFTPATGRSYQAEITRPSTVTEKYALPLAEDKGCVLRTYDDFDGAEKALRVGVRCTERQKVIVAATVRDRVLDVGSIEAGDDTPGVIYLAAADDAIQQAAGVARVTVFDRDLNPLAERLTFRNRRARLDVKAELDKKSYAPRGQVALAITTRDASGKPVAAELAVSVVDDTVISFADDKSGHLLSKLLLEPELPGKVEEPNFYLDLTEAKSALGLDLLMGARGYRRFDWVAVLRSTPRSSSVASALGGMRAMDDAQPLRRGMMQALPAPMAVPAPAGAMRPQVVAASPPPREELAQALQIREPVARDRKAMADQLQGGDADARQAGVELKNEMRVDKEFGRALAKQAVAMPEEQAWAPVRVFPVPVFNADYGGVRNDYRETVFWAPSVKTDKRGKATVKFVLSDAVTSFRVFSEGVGGGLAGRDETLLKSSLPFSLAVKLPLELSAGDRPLIPVTLTNDSAQSLDVKLDAGFGALMRASTEGARPGSGGTLAAGQRRSLFFPLDVTGTRGVSDVHLTAAASGLRDEVLRSIPVVPVGFPQLFEKSGQITGTVSHEIDLGTARKGSVQATVMVYTSMLSTTVSGLDGMLREPSGCFEQTSSTNYPNVMIMQYLKAHDVADTALVERSSKLLDSGYRKLTGYESPKKGFEWFGGDPGHEALTAYGLMQFADMKDVYGAVDGAMLSRTGAWLKTRRDGNGGYLRDPKALDSFGRASPEVTDAYITWALVSAGETGLDKEIARSMKLAETTQDAYQLALATGTLLQRDPRAAPSTAALAAAAKLAKMQSSSGAWTNADHSITHSGGSNLTIETTSLAILALLKTDRNLEEARKGVAWLQNNRSGFGQWGATQATVLALKAMNRFDDVTRVAPRSGAVKLSIDGVTVAEQTFEAGRREPIVFTGFDDKLAAGKHVITLSSRNADPLPYSVAVEYRTTEPASSKSAVVQLDATLAKTELKMGETVRLDAVISNRTQSGQPMTMARLGLPGGLTFQNWQLKELREKGQIAFFETRAREVIFYFRDMKPGEVKKLAIDLVASVPGTYTGPASSAYLYYNDTDKSWVAPLQIRITP
jgi:alpha-2-macroglobulin-like protein